MKVEGRPPVALRASPGALPVGLVFLVCGVVAALAVAFLHLDRTALYFCTFKAVTGWPCVTCGTTRAVARLASLDLGGAFSMNPLAAAAAALIVPWGLGDLALVRRGRALVLELSPAAGRALRILAVAALGLNWIYLVSAGR